jgi:hypothetical protein
MRPVGLEASWRDQVSTSVQPHIVLRARIGVDYPDTFTTREIEDAVADAIRRAVADLRADLDVLQVSVAIDPAWSRYGPDNRVDDRPIP